jgi:hypothetical protein
MSNKSLRSNLVSGFGGAGGTLIIMTTSEILLGIDFSLPLWFFLIEEFVGVVFIIMAILLHVTDKERKPNQ